MAAAASSDDVLRCEVCGMQLQGHSRIGIRTHVGRCQSRLLGWKERDDDTSGTLLGLCSFHFGISSVSDRR